GRVVRRARGARTRRACGGPRTARGVQRQGGARWRRARRTLCTLTVQPRAPTTPLGPSRRPQDGEKGPAARRRPMAAREAYSLYVERAAEGANDADGPFSAAPGRREGSSGKAAPDGCTRGVLSVR